MYEYVKKMGLKCIILMLFVHINTLIYDLIMYKKHVNKHFETLYLSYIRRWIILKFNKNDKMIWKYIIKQVIA